jgi:2-polyprenyl-3-methyl-5-hydroxy-6-metoxy-1,4-benzoquinol methylase
MPVDASTLERLVPAELDGRDVTGRQTLELHLERYRFAARCARPGRLLDLACGVGYGTRLVADEAAGVERALGVDLAPEAVAYARAHYGRDGVEFAASDGLTFRDPAGFDTIVSLETLEHVPAPARLVVHLAGMLRPGGVLVASAPTTPSTDVNLHHLHDFTERSFRRLFAGLGLTEETCFRQVQPYELFAAVARKEQRMADLRSHLLRYYLTHPWAALRRAVATLRFGFSNRYLTVAWRSRPA